ncbi:hypothetical protein JOL79_03095 [Microbispora sp. RL4-1S]|uniref:histidine kinase n=1 Tax=Microbispora oryzae TaxID=2806554 RepID=A0A940WDV2_9ACTN|nr:hypothetical protein [Microbispora oryzae]MBP2702788.1 hypothetical protein [Microbispora oryzae]
MSAPRWSGPLLVAGTLVGTVLGTLVVVMGPHPDSTTFPATILVLGWSGVACAVVLILQPFGRRIGLIFLLLGLSWTLRGLAFLPAVPHPVSTAVRVLPLLLLVEAFSAPLRQGRSRWELACVVVGRLLPLTLVPDYLLGDRGADEPCLTCVSLQPELFSSWVRVAAHVHIVVLAALVLAVVASPARRAGPRGMWPVRVITILCAALIAAESASPAVLGPEAVDELRVLFNATGVSLLVMAPPAFLAGTLHTWLEHARAERENLRLAAQAHTAAALREIQRDLHDGAQLRMLKAAIAVRLARTSVAEPEVGRSLDAAAEELRQALEDLRRLAVGEGAGDLRARGLPRALERLAAASPVPVTVDAEQEGAVPQRVAETVYFVAAEALANVTKHASAQSASLSLHHVNGSELELVIGDDGAGGARLTPGGGLTGLTERVAAIGGTLEVLSPEGAGTTIKAVIPCVSSSPTTQH